MKKILLSLVLLLLCQVFTAAQPPENCTSCSVVYTRTVNCTILCNNTECEYTATYQLLDCYPQVPRYSAKILSVEGYDNCPCSVVDLIQKAGEFAIGAETLIWSQVDSGDCENLYSISTAACYHFEGNPSNPGYYKWILCLDNSCCWHMYTICRNEDGSLASVTYLSSAPIMPCLHSTGCVPICPD